MMFDLSAVRLMLRNSGVWTWLPSMSVESARRRLVLLALPALVFALLLVVHTMRTSTVEAPQPPKTRAPPPAGRLSEPAVEQPTPLPLDAVVAKGLVLSVETWQPIEGATVTADDEAVRRMATTDQTGSFALVLPRYLPDSKWARVRAEGFAPGWVRITSWRDVVEEQLRPALLNPIVGSLRGRVVDLAGDAVEGALVCGNTSSGSFRTDEEGRFGPVPAALGQNILCAFREDHPAAEETVEVARGVPVPEVTIVLPDAVFVEGRVVDGEGRPVPGALVFEEYAWDAHRVRADDEGGFRIPLRNGEIANLRTEKPGYIEEEMVPAFAGGDVQLTLKRAAGIQGRILAADGTPPPPRLDVGFGGAWARVGADGSFRLGPLCPGAGELRVGYKVLLTVYGPAFDPLLPFGEFPLKLAPGEMREGAVFRLPPHVTAEGYVTDAETGEPIAGAEILRAVAGTDGGFSLPLPAKWHQKKITVGAWAPGYEQGKLRLLFRNEAYAVKLRPSARLRLRAMDCAGRPLPGADVHIQDWLSSHPTGPAGRVEIDVPAPGATAIEVDHPIAGRFVTPVVFESGVTVDLGDVVLLPEEADVFLVVVDERESRYPAPAWQVAARSVLRQGSSGPFASVGESRSPPPDGRASW